MMPRATHLLAVDDTVGERPVVMRTERTYGEELLSSSHQQYILSLHNALQLAAVRNAVDRNAFAEIGLPLSFHTHSTLAAILLRPGSRHCWRTETHLTPHLDAGSKTCSLWRGSMTTQAHPGGKDTGQDTGGKNDAHCLQRLAFYHVSGVVDCVFGGAAALFDAPERRSDAIVHGFSDY